MNHYCFMQSIVGELLLVSDGRSLTGVYMAEHKQGPAPENSWLKQDDLELLLEAKDQLNKYFSGNLTEFDLPLSMKGTDFQRRVWQELRKIGYGMTVSYAELAKRLEHPLAVRAVANANAKNPISIIVPCHRVIGSNGKLTGYAGGLMRKQALLSLESRVLNQKELSMSRA